MLKRPTVTCKNCGMTYWEGYGHAICTKRVKGELNRVPRAVLTLTDKHYHPKLHATWCNDGTDADNGVVLMIEDNGAKHSIGLSFADAKTLAKFVTEGRP
jgi:hypothetical protein